MKDWAIFWLLGVIWGSSFLLIKVAVEELGPLPLVSVRIGLAALFMLGFLALTGRRLPSARRERLALLFVGVMNTAVPFTLITWGEQDIDSGLATVLNATVPLWTLIFAHVALADERFSSQKLVGLLVGFAGVGLLASRANGAESANSLSGQLAVLVASACYAVSAVVIRRYLRRVEPLTIAGTSLIVGGVVVVLATLLTVRPLPALDALSAKTTAAAITLALLNTVIAYFLFYHLIDTWGATRTTLVTYVMPPIGVTLGWLFLDEPVDWKIVVGAALILAGIVAVNWRRAPAPAAPVIEAVSPGSD
ncbi:MAG TPA: EamA family transporter, partial [Aggregatilineaceae bacterium]|nr:EamA family transporter [Aggregatilineaceae bacterium]